MNLRAFSFPPSWSCEAVEIALWEFGSGGEQTIHCRNSIPPKKLVQAQFLQMLYSVRSERLLMEEIDYSVLFRWFVGMNLDEPVWDVTIIHQESEPLAGRRRGSGVSARGGEASAGERPHER